MVLKGKGEAVAVLAREEDTLALGRLMARALPGGEQAQNIFLSGPLGAGKTTLVRGLVKDLPGGDRAEVSSPSFNIVNYYPTRPECAHFDLYRLEGFAADESLTEALGAGTMLVLVEWAQYLGPEHRPEHWLEIEWKQSADAREAHFTASGQAAEEYVNNIIALAGNKFQAQGN